MIATGERFDGAEEVAHNYDASRTAFPCRMSAFFLFEPGSDRVVCERIYFDSGTILQQLGLGVSAGGIVAAE